VTLVREQGYRGMTVRREQDHSLVCLDMGQLLGLDVRGVVVKPSVLQRTVWIAAKIALGGIFGAV
jgi:hypothetical protein